MGTKEQTEKEMQQKHFCKACGEYFWGREHICSKDNQKGGFNYEKTD